MPFISTASTVTAGFIGTKVSVLEGCSTKFNAVASTTILFTVVLAELTAPPAFAAAKLEPAGPAVAAVIPIEIF